MTFECKHSTRSKMGKHEKSIYIKTITLWPEKSCDHGCEEEEQCTNSEQNDLNLMMISCEDSYPYGPSENTAVSRRTLDYSCWKKLGRRLLESGDVCLHQQSINRRLVFVAQFLLLLIRGRNSPSSSSSSVPPVLYTYILILNIIPPSPFSPHCGGEEYVPISVRESIQSITPLDSNQQRENSNHINHNNRL